MLKRVLKWLGAIVAVVVIALAVFIVNLIWFRPWSLNLFYEKVFAEVIFDHPELLSTLGLVEQFGITGHNGKLDDESSAHQQQEFDRWKRDLTQLREYPLDRQSSSQKLSTHVLEWFLQMQVEAKSGSGTIIQSISCSACRTNFLLSWQTRTGCSPAKIASIT